MNSCHILDRQGSVLVKTSVKRTIDIDLLQKSKISQKWKWKKVNLRSNVMFKDGSLEKSSNKGSRIFIKSFDCSSLIILIFCIENWWPFRNKMPRCRYLYLRCQHHSFWAETFKYIGHDIFNGDVIQFLKQIADNDIAWMKFRTRNPDENWWWQKIYGIWNEKKMCFLCRVFFVCRTAVSRVLFFCFFFLLRLEQE